MPVDSQDLASFYEEGMGQVARRLIGRRIRMVWPDLRGLRLLGYGYPAPYIRTYLGEAERVVGFVPAEQEIPPWPKTHSLVALGEEDALPFPDSFFDRIVLVHGLETAESARPLMRQVWRLLAPQGRLLLVVPNRGSFWAQVERSPFARGRPFNRGQLDRLLRESMFIPEQWDTALFFPPLRVRRMTRSVLAWERVGRRLWPRFAGVYIVDATKSLYALVPPAKLRGVRRVLVPATT
ncbi:MAG TPA: methyltransferase domain-containing protein [Rhizomicrobium sp.]|nr:methyltransferase domain-containing protein [Rhizomicrobium sp.]